MNDVFSNRLTSFHTALTFANDPARKAVWFNVIPKSFTTKMAEAATMYATLADWCAAQSASIKGKAEAKDIEETQLEEAAFTRAQALVTYLLDHDMVAEAEPFRRAKFWWQGLRDTDLLARSQDVINAMTPLTTGPGAAANAENYGISAASLAALVAERTEYAAVATTPAAAKANRKALTALMRAQFLPLTQKFRELDRLVVQFAGLAGGPAFVSGWFAARSVVDAGHGPGTGGGSGGPTLPAAPTGVTISQENPGDAVALGASVGAGVTLVKFFARPAGSSEAPALITSAAELPTSASGVGPGEYEWTATAVSAAGESAPSAPVLFTVQ